MKVAAFTAVV